MRSALLPAIRVSPRLRQRVEALLQDEETLSSFVETAVLRQAEWREAQLDFVQRGLAAEAEGDWVSAEEVLAAVRKAASAPRRRRRA